MPPRSQCQLIDGRQSSKNQSIITSQIHLNPLQRLRGRLQQGLHQKIKRSQIVQSSNFDLLGTCEQLLAFEMYEQLQEMIKKNMINEIQLMDGNNTRELYQGYLKVRKNGSCKIGENNKNNTCERNQGAKRRIQVGKSVLVAVIVVVLLGSLAKYRELVVKLIKIIFNIKGN